MAGIQRHLKKNGRPELVILDLKNLDFVQTRQVLDARMKHLTTTGKETGAATDTRARRLVVGARDFQY